MYCEYVAIDFDLHLLYCQVVRVLVLEHMKRWMVTDGYTKEKDEYIGKDVENLSIVAVINNDTKVGSTVFAWWKRAPLCFKTCVNAVCQMKFWWLPFCVSSNLREKFIRKKNG